MIIHIMYGLPGSGKTFFCKKEVEGKAGKQYVDIDYLIPNTKGDSFKKKIYHIARDYLASKRFEVYFDGLITTHQSLLDVLSGISEAIKEPYDIIIDCWNENREICLKNDFKRRNVSSETTIENLTYEPIKNKKEIVAMLTDEQKEKFSTIRISRHAVIEKPEYKQFFDSYGLNLSEDCSHFFGSTKFKNSKYLYSESWCGGGTGSTYSGTSFPISAEEPAEFKEFYDLLETINPNMSFLLFRKIEKECLSIEEIDNSDYYSNTIDYRYKLDLERMYSLIHDWNH